MVQWINDAELSKKLNDCYKRYYLKYHGTDLSNKPHHRNLAPKDAKRAKSAEKQEKDEFSAKKTSVLEDFFSLKFKYLKVEKEEKNKHRN